MLDFSLIGNPISLTPTQRTVAALVREGLFRHEIASTLGMTQNAVEAEIKTVYAVLGISDLLSLAFYARYHNFDRFADQPSETLTVGSGRRADDHMNRFKTIP